MPKTLVEGSVGPKKMTVAGSKLYCTVAYLSSCDPSIVLNVPFLVCIAGALDGIKTYLDTSMETFGGI